MRKGEEGRRVDEERMTADQRRTEGRRKQESGMESDICRTKKK